MSICLSDTCSEAHISVIVVAQAVIDMSAGIIDGGDLVSGEDSINICGVVKANAIKG